MPIEMVSRDMVKRILAVNTCVQRLVENMVIMVHAGDVAMVEGDRYHKLKLIDQTPVVAYLVAVNAVHRMALVFEEESIDS